MDKKPTHRELEQRIKELEKEVALKKQMEERLNESEAKYRHIIENMPLGIHKYSLSPDGQLRFIGANPAGETCTIYNVSA